MQQVQIYYFDDIIIGKHLLRQFYNDSYYSAIYNKTNYYPDDNTYLFTVVKNFNVIQYALSKPDPDKGLPRFDVVCKMDGSIYTVVETVKKLGNVLGDYFEDKNHLTFQLTKQFILPGISRIEIKSEYKLNINQYGDVVFILESFNK
jgi:hypothetical protein